MQLFNEYIQPLNHWLYNNPDWSTLITFIVAFSESLTLIGAIIPGSVTMTILGILAGTGVIRLDLTIIAATFGAIVGDWASYLLGYYYSEKIASIWPFSRYPSWIYYGKDFFNKHGGKSVLIGRFVGPFRSIIPVIAGMMHMPQSRFFLANFFSAIGWAILYIMPGFLIGAASAELSPERATQLFIWIVLFIAGLWLFTLVVKRLLIYFNQFLNHRLPQIWAWSNRHSYFSFFFKSMTPEGEINHYATALLFSTFLLTTILFIIISLSVIFSKGFIVLNKPVFLFLQSVRTHFFDLFFTLLSGTINSMTLTLLGILVSILLILQKNWRTLGYWLALHSGVFLLVFLCQQLITSPYPQAKLIPQFLNSFPAQEVTLATSQFFSIWLYFRNNKYRRVLAIYLSLILALGSFAQIYFGDQWLLDSLGGITLGISISLFYWMLYRKTGIKSYVSTSFIFLIGGALIGFAILVTYRNYDLLLKKHRQINTNYFVTNAVWWNQKMPVLPIYRKNRIGKPVALFNIQYLGSLTVLEKALSEKGWKKENDTLLNTLITRISGTRKGREQPLMAELYLFQKPALTMTLETKNHPLLVLKFWQSRYFIDPSVEVLWLGSVQYKFLKPYTNYQDFLTPLSLITKSLPQFIKKEVSLPLDPATTKAMRISPTLLLIRELP